MHDKCEHIPLYHTKTIVIGGVCSFAAVEHEFVCYTVGAVGAGGEGILFRRVPGPFYRVRTFEGVWSTLLVRGQG